MTSLLARTEPTLRRAADWIARQIKVVQTRYRWLGYVITAGALLYVVILFAYGWSQLEAVNWGRFAPALAISLLLYQISLLVQFIIWVRFFSTHHRASWQDVDIYARVLLLRRLPGGIWHWVGRTAMYSARTTVPAKVAALANVWELLMLLLVAAGIVLYTQPQLATVAQVSLGTLCILAALILGSQWQSEARPGHLRLVESLGWTALYALAWGLGGGIVYLLGRAAGAETLTLSAATRIWATAGGVGMLIVFIPAGLGIREITLTWLLQPYMPSATAILVAVLMRLLFIVADVLGGGMGWGLSAYFLGRAAQSEFSADPPGHEEG